MPLRDSGYAAHPGAHGERANAGRRRAMLQPRDRPNASRNETTTEVEKCALQSANQQFGQKTPTATDAVRKTPAKKTNSNRESADEDKSRYPPSRAAAARLAEENVLTSISGIVHDNAEERKRSDEKDR